MELADVDSALIECRRCPRLVEWRERIAAEKRAAFAGEEYWGRPVPGFGDPDARLVVVGLAPAAHGANRTGRMFTGDRSGDWLFRALHRAGFANRPTSEHAGDGLELTDCYVTSVVHCAPPGNRPTAEERRECGRWLELTFAGLSAAEVVVALGGVAHTEMMRLAARIGWDPPRPRPRFSHGGEVTLRGGPRVVGSYHPSQQNTFTGRLTEPMLDAVFGRARRLLSQFPLRP